MSKQLEVKNGNKTIYNILLEEDFGKLSDALVELELTNKNVVIFTDSNVGSLYSESVEKLLNPIVRNIYVFEFQAGEASKNLSIVNEAYEFLLDKRIERSDFLIALGGGVVGDLTGYVAATYLRGIKFIQIPTSLLAQVDSSIGGKTGVDYNQYKNIIGAFHMPSLVYINIATLRTLEDIQFSSGMAEILKAGLIKDAAFYEWCINNFYEINDRDSEYLMEMIYNSCAIKQRVVQKDPFEKGERALLNFGHTAGHAIEKEMNFTKTHGACVALGCIVAAYISYKRELLSCEEYYEIRDMFVPFNLPIQIDDLNVENVIKAMRNDKKWEDGRLKFILLKKIGKAYIDTTVTESEIIDAINEIIYNWED